MSSISDVGMVPGVAGETSAVGAFAGTRSAAGSRTGWCVAAVLFASVSVMTGVVWDISWHRSIGRDSFWTPAHMAIYVGGIVAGLSCGWLALSTTFRGTPAEKAATVRFWRFFHAPLGAWVAIWGAFAMITSAPFDDWWHNAYGLDVEILSPPHVVLALGIVAIQFGALLMLAARQNRAESGQSGSGRSAGGSVDGGQSTGGQSTGGQRLVGQSASGSVDGGQSVGGQSTGGQSVIGLAESGRADRWLYAIAGGILLVMVGTLISEYTLPNTWHQALPYKIMAGALPLFIVGVGRAGRLRWPATTMVVVYWLAISVIGWILQLFPAQPLLAPIFNPIDHFVAPTPPLMLLPVGLGVDLVLRAWRWNDWLLAPVLGAVFVVLLIATLWPWGEFMLSPAARNWFFMGDQWAYQVVPGPWWHEFWDTELDPLFTAGSAAWVLGLGTVSTGIGLWWGNWMKRVKR